jgi:hypothetical protein
MKFLVKDSTGFTWQPGSNIVFNIPDSAELVCIEAPSFGDDTASVIVHTEEADAPIDPETAAVSKADPASVITVGRKDSVAAEDAADTASVSSTSPARLSNGVELPLEKLTLTRLKAMAKEAGLPVRGKKADIITRLRDHASN